MDHPSSGELLLFVYGTLKRGFHNHTLFCEGVLRVEEAAVRGELHDLPFGFPGLVVPPETIRTTGTADPALDAATQRRLNGAAPPAGRTDGPRAFGELLAFDDPGERLPQLDYLEGFDPKRESLYRRVLIPAKTPTRTILAWAYAIEKLAGTHLPGGRWPA